MTFMPASSPCADMVPLVAAALAQQRPMITVFVNYRLNIFAFGDRTSSKNLALKDQRLAIAWVFKHIAHFGGDAVSFSLPLPPQQLVSPFGTDIILGQHYACRRERWCGVRSCPYGDTSSHQASDSAVGIIVSFATAARSASNDPLRQT